MFGLRRIEDMQREEKMKLAALARFLSDNKEMTDEVRTYMGIQAAIGAGFNVQTGNREDVIEFGKSKNRIEALVEASGKVLDGEIEELITEVAYRISN